MEGLDYRQSDTYKLVREFYRDERGNPLELTEGQLEIFDSIAKKKSPRVHIMCHTRYGKSMTAAVAVLTRVTTFPEKWAIVAGNKDKAGIIMGKVIEHLFDNDYVLSRFLPDSGDSIEEIRRYRNKNHLTFKISKTAEGKDLYGEIFIGSAKEALGQGSPNVIEDESSLIEDDDHSFVTRMLGDDPHMNFLCKIGNPFNRNHFLESYQDPAYQKIVIDCYRSLKEGRITQNTIDENRPYSFFKVLYECIFPSASEVDETGWMYLLLDEEIKSAIERKIQPRGLPRLGLDVARGGRNYNVWVKRWDNQAVILDKNHDDDLTSTGDHTINLMRENGVSQDRVFVDDTGVGGGVTDYLKSLGVRINPVNLGERSTDPACLNVRADVYAGKNGVSAWIKQGGSLIDNKGWYELTKIRYKKDSSGRTKIEPKEDMRKRGVESPDVADALALTFGSSKRREYHPPDLATILSGGVKPYIPGVG